MDQASINANSELSGGPALKGIRVVDLTQFEAGTSCTLLLAWLGAEVIKVERPKIGEQGRGADGKGTVYFNLLNANKKSVTCDLKTEAGKEFLRRLIATADVFLENFAPGNIERLGFGYDEVKKIKPDIVYGQVKGFAPGTEYENYLCFDNIAQAMGGIMSVNGFPGNRPVRAGVTIGDTGTGLHFAVGVLSALIHRNRTGEGQKVFISQWEAMTNFMRMAYQGPQPATPKGNASSLRSSAPSEVYPCKDGGYVFIYSTRARDHQWKALLTVMGRQDLIGDPRFATGPLRYQNREEVDRIVGEWTCKYTKFEAMQILQKGGMPAGAVMNSQELANHPDMRKRGMYSTVDDPQLGTYSMVGCPINLEKSPVSLISAPALGSDNDTYYSELGYTPEQIKSMRDVGEI